MRSAIDKVNKQKHLNLGFTVKEQKTLFEGVPGSEGFQDKDGHV